MARDKNMKKKERSFVKVPADSVPYGEQHSANGKHVWAVYEDGELLCLGATRKEAQHNAYGAKPRLDALRRTGEWKGEDLDALWRKHQQRT